MSSEGKAVKQAKSAADESLANATDKASTLKDKVSDNISNIADKIHQGADSGKAILSEQTEKVSALANQALDKAGNIKQKAANAVSNSSEYVKNFDLEETRESIKSAVKENPEVLLITVGILGLAVGYLLGKKNA